MAAMEKVYPCLACKQDIRLERKDNHWVKWNLDGTAHVHPTTTSTTKKKEEQQQVLQQQKQQKQVQQQLPQSELADLQDEVAELKAQIKSLVTQVQLLQFCSANKLCE